MINANNINDILVNVVSVLKSFDYLGLLMFIMPFVLFSCFVFFMWLFYKLIQEHE